ncbi:hypothetical protein PVL30_003205 [Lodderomyces elongisporus]|uniref:uncharacterized protein n=1 Tax=Lodderomyces elongisporus TaxID=36914 RepID=UPI002925425E|nr:uncharacterized protein PVL30_003205 [Lodderomyces elongisporus]WLF79450.1 hypothetical protein PVL30_003205 [Lodderomyces elongisporus]
MARISHSGRRNHKNNTLEEQPRFGDEFEMPVEAHLAQVAHDQNYQNFYNPYLETHEPPHYYRRAHDDNIYSSTEATPHTQTQTQTQTQTHTHRYQDPYQDPLPQTYSPNRTPRFNAKLYTADPSVEGFETFPSVYKTKDELVKTVDSTEIVSSSSLENQPILQNEKRLFSWLFSKKVPEIPADEERTDYPWHKANPFLRLGFWWLWPVLKKGYKRTLFPEDLFKLTPELKVEYMYNQWNKHLTSIISKHNASNPKSSDWPKHAIPYALFLTFKWHYLFSCVCLALAFTVIACSPLITRQLIDFVEYRYFQVYTTYNRGIWLTFVAVILIFVNGLLLNHFFHNAMICGAQAKAILTKALLMKSFKLDGKAQYKFPPGRVTSLMSTDLARIDLAIGFQPLVLCFPIPVVISIAILLKNIGVAALSGIGLFLVSLIVCVLLTKKLFTTREKVVCFTDERVSLMREILNNLKIIKFYAWEMAYKAAIAKVRNKEMRHLFTIKVLRNFITAYALTLPVLTSMVSFITMWATNNMKSPGEVFSSLSLYAILAQAIMLLPIALATGADALIGFQRCNAFLSAEEFHDELAQQLNEKNYYLRDSPANKVTIKVSHADFHWEDNHADDTLLDPELWDIEEEDIKIMKEGSIYSNQKQQQQQQQQQQQMQTETHSPYGFESDSASCSTITNSNNNQFQGLSNVNLTINRGEFVIITGVIGSGKTSLLHALAGILKITNPSRGQLIVNDKILLCSSPWIQNATVRENITFGKPFDIAKYKQVLFACALEDDIRMLPAGDRTEIGERGITLSGGQKARINLARACYADAEILLFDDVISAVDSKVARHIVSHLFKGLLKHKTIVLATHQLGILDFADKVVFIDNGSVYSGLVPQLKHENNNFRKLLDHGEDRAGDAENAASTDNLSEVTNLQRLPPLTDGASASAGAGAGAGFHEGHQNDISGRTTLDEVRATNSISWKIYKKYIELGAGIFGKFAVPLFLLLVTIATFCQVFTNTWLSFWVEKKFPDKSDHFYITIYVVFAFLTVIFTGIEFSMLAYMQDCSANSLNLKAVGKILHAPMSFMDTTPLGRILNRFTKDTDSLDNEIGEQMRLFIFPLALIIGIIILCTCYLPYFAVAVPFLAFGFLFLANFYQGSSREIKRLEATQRSLVYNNFNETLTGMATIKSFGAEQDFIRKNDYFLDKMNEAYYLSIATQRWLCVHLDIITSCFALIICLLCITEQFSISASSTGLLLNYVMQLVGVLSLTVRSMTSVENEMNSVERLHEYAFDLPQESAYIIDKAAPPQEWPASGYITFKDVHLRYRSNLPFVLKGLDVNFYPGEKVGICGRTGAGKSSIMSALYRLVEVEQGKIEIDGLDISQMGLFDLRSRLSIIPQDPVLFQGTIRRNLDPFGEYDTYTLWKALAATGLIEESQIPYLSSVSISDNGVSHKSLHKFHLDQLVDDDGLNFSLGEKQLIALARALVRNSKILVLDEATSSVDFATDGRIQELINREFKNCTVLCIAHRLKTILNYDRVIVMDKGAIAEKGDPWKLYNDNGVFRSMCDKANIRAGDFP